MRSDREIRRICRTMISMIRVIVGRTDGQGVGTAMGRIARSRVGRIDLRTDDRIEGSAPMRVRGKIIAARSSRRPERMNVSRRTRSSRAGRVPGDRVIRHRARRTRTAGAR